MNLRSAIASPDLRQAAYTGRWIFVVLLGWGVILTATLFYRAVHKDIISEADLTFDMRGATGIEENIYTNYFANLKTSELRAKSVQFSRGGSAIVKVDVELSGRDDPRLKQVLDGLLPVRDKALGHLQTEINEMAAEIRAFDFFFQGGKLQGIDDSTVQTLHRRLSGLRTRHLFYEERVRKPEVPVLVAISGSDRKRKLIIESIANLLAVFFTAAAGALVFGYGRLLAAGKAGTRQG